MKYATIMEVLIILRYNTSSVALISVFFFVSWKDYK